MVNTIRQEGNANQNHRKTPLHRSQGFPGGSVVKNLPATQEMQVQSLCQEYPLEEAWQPTPVLLPGESHEERSLVGYSPWGDRGRPH